MRLVQVPENRIVSILVLSFFLLVPSLVYGDTIPGRAEVRALKGNVTYSTNGGPARAIKVGMILRSGSTIKTGSDSTVDLFLGNSAGVIRLVENSTVSFDKLTLTDTGADTAVEVQINLPDGDMYFNVNKLSKGSRYEVKMPNGVAGIRGTKGNFSFRPKGSIKPPIILLEGSVFFVHMAPGGEMASYIMTAPPAVYFSPVGGIQVAPPALTDAVTKAVDAMTKKATPMLTPPPPATRNKAMTELFLSPNGGAQPK